MMKKYCWSEIVILFLWLVVLFGCTKSTDYEGGGFFTPLGNINFNKIGSSLEQEFIVPETKDFWFCFITDGMTKKAIEPLKLHAYVYQVENTNVIYNCEVEGTNMIYFHVFNDYTEYGYEWLSLDINGSTDYGWKSIIMNLKNGNSDMEPPDTILKTGSLYNVNIKVLSPALLTNKTQVYYLWSYKKKPDYGRIWTNKYGACWKP